MLKRALRSNLSVLQPKQGFQFANQISLKLTNQDFGTNRIYNLLKSFVYRYRHY